MPTVTEGVERLNLGTSIALQASTRFDSSIYSMAASHSSSSSRRDSSGNSTRSTVSNPNFVFDVLKKDNRLVTLVRCAVLLVLLTAAVLTSYYSYKVTRDAQIRAYVDAFDGVSSKMVPGLVSDLSTRLWQARTVAATVKTKIEDKNVKPHLLDFESDAFATITEEARLHTNVYITTWNPLLKTEQERLEFEWMAALTTPEIESTTGGNPVCYVCGSPTRTFSNPDLFIEIPGIGPSTCRIAEVAGLTGAIPESTCALVEILQGLGCICDDGMIELEESSTDEEVPFIPRPNQVAMVDEETGLLVPSPNGTAPYMPLWTVAAGFVDNLPTMWDQMTLPYAQPLIQKMIETNAPMFTETITRSSRFYQKYTGSENQTSVTLYYPVAVDDEVVGSVAFELLWFSMVTSVIPGLGKYVDVVVENSLGQNITFGVDPTRALLLYQGHGDLHDPAFDSTVQSSTFEEFDIISYTASSAWDVNATLHCRYRFHVFAKQELKDLYVNSDPTYFSVVTATIFMFTSLVFIFYDCLVRRVQRKVVASAKHTTAIVSSLFPKNVRDRLLQDAAEQSNEANGADAPMRISKMRMQSFLAGGTEDNTISTFNTEPIADLFASATVMFLDICSFTAWSSEREPSQVFVLLETIYQSFDEIANKLKVFKVETIGDSYVAVCGLPTRREGHAPVMAKFAQRCMEAMRVVTKNLEVRLGPSTGSLQARVGLHSGPVTAGVMRGEKARFQLFGDTVNTASRLESTGKPGRIHLSQNCVDLLEKAGKGQWVRKRDKLVTMKGKGDLQTYFLKNGIERPAPSPSLRSSRTAPKSVVGGRLVEWNTECLYDFLKQIVVHRYKRGKEKHTKYIEYVPTGSDTLVIDELTETLCLPSVARNTSGSTDEVKITSVVKGQLHTFVKRIAEMYRDVPFHNFEHCSHVLMSTSKLMKRIVNPDDIDYQQTDNLVAIAIHKTTYGISSDPILQFASLFAALIHDVDHTGLTNAELVDEEAMLATAYRNQSVAEQNSVDLAWGILMEPDFEDLRRCIYSSEDELTHFRQLVVNAVMATDIADKELKQAREKRWALTFPVTDDPVESAPSGEVESQLDRDRKATIVFEYIIQASDVCHTMQHWHTYQKFNKRLFEERYVAWMAGSLKKEPSLGWYGGELWFFDNYIIPTAHKLDKCGVFGVSYQEYLTYAIENRKEWERKGHEIVAEMKSFCDGKYSSLLEMNESRHG